MSVWINDGKGNFTNMTTKEKLFKNKSLIDRLKEIEDRTYVRDDHQTIREARFLIERICKALESE